MVDLLPAHAKAVVHAWAVDSGVPGRRESSLFDLHEVVRQVDWDANIAMIADAESERQMKKLRKRERNSERERETERAQAKRAQTKDAAHNTTTHISSSLSFALF